MEEAAGEEEEVEDGADDDLKTRTPYNDVGKKSFNSITYSPCLILLV